MSKLKVDEIRQSTRSVSASANITLANDGTLSTGNLKIPDGGTIGSASDADAISISSAGKVGLGVAAATNDLEIGAYSGDKTLCLTSSTNGNTHIRMNDGDSSEGMFIKTTGAASIAAMKMNIGRNWGGDTNLVTILGDGKVGIGTDNTGGSMLKVKGPTGVSGWIICDATDSSSAAGIRFMAAGVQKWWIYNNPGSGPHRLIVADAGDNSGVYLPQDTASWSSISDDRMKTDWINFSDALTKINTLTKIGKYRRIDPVSGEYVNDDSNVTQTGLSAQEVQKILPSSISKGRRNSELYPDDETEYLGISYQDIFVLGIKAIQELSAKVTALENK
jgi:hypothetical protein